MEIWKDIEGFEGYYKVSNYGNVMSLKRTGATGGLIKPYEHTKGYSKVSLWKGNKGKKMSIHRLVATAFIPNPDNKPQTNHKNGVRDDNHVSNLEWCTNSENQIHRHIRSKANQEKKKEEGFKTYPETGHSDDCHCSKCDQLFSI